MILAKCMKRMILVDNFLVFVQKKLMLYDIFFVIKIVCSKFWISKLEGGLILENYGSIHFTGGKKESSGKRTLERSRNITLKLNPQNEILFQILLSSASTKMS